MVSQGKLTDVGDRVIDDILAASDGSTEKAIYAMRDLCGFKHVTYHGARLGAKAVDEPFIRTTYDAVWVKRYLTLGYVEVDPVVREGFSRSMPFRWDDITLRNEAEHSFFVEAASNDVGMTGLTIPVRDRDNRRAIVSLASDVVGPPWTYYCRTNMRALVELAHVIHQIAVVEQGDRITHPPLSPREMEVLFWTTKGKTVGEIAIILKLRPHTVAAYMRSARYKLNASTVAQAVSVAIQRGLISEA